MPVLQIGFPYSGTKALNGSVVVRAYKAGKPSAAEAQWKMNLQAGSAGGQSNGSSDTNKNTRILGSWRPGVYWFTLSPSSVRPVRSRSSRASTMD